MTAEETGGTPLAADTVHGPDAEVIAPRVAARLEGPTLRATMSAIASADVEELEVTASAVGLAQVAGDAKVSASVVSMLYAKQDVLFQQGYASAVIAGGATHIKQGGAPIIMGRTVDVDMGGGVVLVGGDVSVKNGFAGVVLARNTTVSEDSRVLIGTKAALIIAAALLGGFAMVAVVMALGVKRVVTWRPNITMSEMPHWDELHQKLQKFRESHMHRG